MKDMLRQFRPNSMEDLTLLNAAYRPGPMQYIPEVIKVKHGRAKPRYIADGLEEILSETYGYTIYQEQVMQIFNKIGGFSLGESDIIRRAMSKKKLAVLTDPKTNYQGKFIDGLKAHGASEHDAEELWEQMLDFASYAFNKSHALAYATIAYQTAWLKYHYPAEYMCSVMNWTGNQKLPQLVSECRNMGLQILPPDINRSKEAFTNEENAIIYGFSNIKNVGKTGLAIVAERTKNGAFVSVKDFVLRMIQSDSYNKSAMEVLVKSGAFDAFCDGNRASILMSIEEFVDTTKKMLQKQDKAAEAKKALDNANTSGASEADVKKAAKALERAEKSSEVARDLFTQHSFIMVAENKALKLRDEHELLGVYISGSPFDDYSEAASLVKSRSSAISVASEAPKIRVSVCGIIVPKIPYILHLASSEAAAPRVFDASDVLDLQTTLLQLGSPQKILLCSCHLSALPKNEPKPVSVYLLLPLIPHFGFHPQLSTQYDGLNTKSSPVLRWNLQQMPESQKTGLNNLSQVPYLTQ